MRRFVAATLLLGACGLAETEFEKEVCEMPPPEIGFTAPDGAELFSREWVVDDERSAHGDGLGPLYNAPSCVACHNQGGTGGGGGTEANVTLMRSGGVLHKNGVLTVPPELTTSGFFAGTEISDLFRDATLTIGTRGSSFRAAPPRRNTPALFGMGVLNTVTESDMLAAAAVARIHHPEVTGRVARDVEGTPGRFGWKAQISTLDDFVVAACSNELGLDTPAMAQPKQFATQEIPGNDLLTADLVALSDFVAALPEPSRTHHPHAELGKRRFEEIGCGSCHVEDLGDAKGAFSDLLLHDLGPSLNDDAGSYYGPKTVVASAEAATPQEWRTPPLWGVADSAPYLHDGRASTLEAAIALHGGEAHKIRTGWRALSDEDRDALIAFLETLVAPTT